MHVTLDHLGHRFFGGPLLFTGLSATLDPGRTYALTGPSGSGKSTLLSLLAGWEHPTEGTIALSGIESIRWVFQNPHGVPGRSALDHVALPLLARGLDVPEAESESRTLLRQFRLEHIAERSFRELSGGEAQRLMLARGIASRPDLLLVDEPTAQLDLATSAEVNAVLANVAVADTIVVIATHDEETRHACSDHIDLRDYSGSLA